ncbi:hypothetical protein BH10PSE17_BH10PSE17_30010 [soil metagenome]
MLLRPHVTHPYAWIGHIPFMYLLADLLRPRRFVELGTDSGNSYLAFCQAVASLGLDTECFAVDSWQGDEHARHYGDHVYLTLSSYHEPLYSSFSHLVKSMFDDALPQFADGSIDLLHIDGLHTYDAVKHDFETWLPKLSASAVVLFHDSAVEGRDFGVRRFLDELRDDYEIFEFTHSNGLAVMRIGAGTSESFNAFFDEARSDPAGTRAFFESAAATLLNPATGELEGQVDAASRAVECRLYHRFQDESFDESRSSAIQHSGGEQATFSFDLPQGLRPDFVRVDPAALPGIYRLISVTLRSGSSSITVIAEPTSRRVHVNGEVLDSPGIDGIRLLALDDDPYFEIELSSLWQQVGPGEDSRIDVALAYEQVATGPVMQLLAGEARTVLAKARQTTGPESFAELMATHHGAIDAAINDHGQRIDSLLAQVVATQSAADASTLANHQRLEDQLGQVLHALTERDREVGNLRTELDLAVYWREESERERERLRRSVTEVERRLSALSDEFVELESQSTAQLTALNQHSSHHAMRQNELAARRYASVSQAFDAATRSAIAARGRNRSPVTTRLPLMPLANLEYDATSGSWIATNTDPQFEVGSLSAFAGRWVQLTFTIEPASFWSSVPVLYFDRGHGCSEADAVELPVPATGSANVNHIVMIPIGTLGVRLDPMAQAGHFRIDGMDATPLSRSRAAVLMIRELARREGRRSLLKWIFREMRPLPTPGRLRQFARLIPQRYWRMGTQSSYAHWIGAYEPPESSYAALADGAAHWTSRPLISIVMPVYNTDRRILEAAIQSVRRQVYTNLELCIADDASPDPQVGETLDRFAALDPRIRVVRRKVNGHIVQASNSALELATGEFVALLDHDDLLHPLALHYVVDAINRFPDAAIVYSDEDKIDEFGLRYEPYFKSRFNYDLLLSQNMISHLGVYRRSLIEAVGRFREEFKGSQDYDLALRVVERVDPSQIIHIPRVLYHWRAIPGSTAVDSSEKPYAVLAAHAAVKAHLERTGRIAEVLPVPEMPNYTRVRFALPALAPHVTIIVPTRDRLDLLSTCIDSIIEKTRYASYDIVIVDNGSVEPATLAYLDRLPRDRVSVIRDDRPFNFSALNNRAAASARGPLLCLLNNDIEVRQPEWLDELARLAIRDDVGCVGARLWYPDERLQHGGVLLGIGGIASHSHKFLSRGAAGYFGRAVLHQQLSAVTAACLMVRKSVYQQVGGLEERLSVAFNDIDFCLRVVEAGYRNIWTPAAELVHHESASRGLETSPEKVERFQGEVDFMMKRWRGTLLADPAYSPNLTLVDESFDMAWPPRDLAPAIGLASVTREPA